MKITLDYLKNAKPDTIFASGIVTDTPDGINMTNSGKYLRWVAVRGGIHDWAIYIHFDSYSEEWIQAHGDKIHNRSHVKKLIDADKEALEMYRD